MKASMMLAMVALMSAVAVNAQPFLPGQDMLPLGNLRTTDLGGPYNLTLLDVQANEVKGGIAARMNYTDADIIDFLVNVECLEGLFDTWGTFGRGFNNDLELGGPTPIGAKKANLSNRVRMFMAEVALNEQGHALFTRHAGSSLPCPQVDFTGGFNDFYAAVYGLYPETTVEERFGAPFDPFLNDQNFVLSVLALEELGATGNKGLIGLMTNPVLANGVAGLATSATAQSTVERMLLWDLKDKIVQPFNETALQVFARISEMRDKYDGVQIDDQGLTNTDPRYIAVPYGYVNMIPTDIRGLTRNRSPQMNINILTLGNPEGKGAFFPNGLLGKLNKPTGFNKSGSGVAPFPKCPKVASMAPLKAVGKIAPPITSKAPYKPMMVVDQTALTQSESGPLDNGTYWTRGYTTDTRFNASTPSFSDSPRVHVA